MTYHDTEEVLIRVGREIGRMRRDSGMSQAMLARKLRVKKEVVGKIERGEYNIRLGTLLRIARIFGRQLKISFIKVKGEI